MIHQHTFVATYSISMSVSQSCLSSFYAILILHFNLRIYLSLVSGRSGGGGGGGRGGNWEGHLGGVIAPPLSWSYVHGGKSSMEEL